MDVGLDDQAVGVVGLGARAGPPLVPLLLPLAPRRRAATLRPRAPGGPCGTATRAGRTQCRLVPGAGGGSVAGPGWTAGANGGAAWAVMPQIAAISARPTGASGSGSSVTGHPPCAAPASGQRRGVSSRRTVRRRRPRRPARGGCASWIAALARSRLTRSWWRGPIPCPQRPLRPFDDHAAKDPEGVTTDRLPGGPAGAHAPPRLGTSSQAVSP